MPLESGLVNKFFDFEALTQEQAKYVRSWEETFAKTAAKAAASVYSAGAAVNNSSSTGDQVAKTKELGSAIKDAEEALKRKNAELEKGYALIDKQQQKEKESKAKQDARDYETALKSLNAESEKRAKAIQKEIDYLKKHGEETTKLTRLVAAQKVAYGELVLKEGEHSAATQAMGKLYDENRAKLTHLQQILGDHTQDVGRYGKVWDTLKSSWVAITGVIAGVWAAIQAGKVVLEANNAIQTQWKIITTQASTAYTTLINTFATGQGWGALFTNMRIAISLAKEQVEQEEKLNLLQFQITLTNNKLKAQAMTLYETIYATKDLNVKQKAAQDYISLMRQVADNEKTVATEKRHLDEISFTQAAKNLAITKEQALAIATMAPGVLDFYKKYIDKLQEQFELQHKYVGATEAKTGLPGTPSDEDVAKLEKVNQEISNMQKTPGFNINLVSQIRDFVHIGGDTENGIPKVVSEMMKYSDSINNIQTGFEQTTRRMQSMSAKTGNQIDAQEAKSAKEIAKHKDAIQVLDDAISKLNSLLIDQASAGNISAQSTANQIALLQSHKRALEELIWVLKNPELQKGFTPGFHAPQRTAVKVDTGAPTLDKPEKVSNPEPDFQKEPISPEDLAAEKEKKAWEKRLETVRGFVNQIQNIVNSLYEGELQKIDENKRAIDDKYQAEYDAASGNASKQKEIKKRQQKEDAELDKQTRKIKHDQAVLNKILGAANAGINTAVGATAMLANPGGIFGMVLAILAIALGAIEIGVILATPIPALKKGRKGGPATFAKVSEEGQEGMKYKGKFSLLPERESLAYIPEGASVIPHHELMDMAGQASLGGVQMWPAILNKKQDNTELVTEIRDLKHAVKNKREVHLNIDKNGFRVAANSGAVWEKYLNDHIRL